MRHGRRIVGPEAVLETEFVPHPGGIIGRLRILERFLIGTFQPMHQVKQLRVQRGIGGGFSGRAVVQGRYFFVEPMAIVATHGVKDQYFLYIPGKCFFV
jgi:hypothetical protein